MRIIIETNGSEGVSVSKDGSEGIAEAAEATDGGSPPDELLQLLTDGTPEIGPEGETAEAGDPENAGEVPSWLVDVIEGSPPPGSGGPEDG